MPVKHINQVPKPEQLGPARMLTVDRTCCMMPAGLLQVREGAAATGVLLGGENALPCFVPGGVDQYALDRIVYNTKPWSPPLQVSQ